MTDHPDTTLMVQQIMGSNVSTRITKYTHDEMREAFTLGEIKRLRAGKVVEQTDKWGTLRWVDLDTLGRAKLEEDAQPVEPQRSRYRQAFRGCYR